MKDVSLQHFLKSYSHFMHRYHVIIFTIVIVGGLSVATYLMYRVTIASSTPTGTTTTGFDKATIDRINQLRSVDDKQEPLKLPPGRINPFKG